ncbi:MAG: DUF1015 family protein [Chitinispirillia bacterium]|jgi:uncharacterized protein (DUF1015 family)
MSDIQPFKGLRPKPEYVKKVASPPFDVISSQEARKLTRYNSLSFLRVIKAEIDLDPSIDIYSSQVYTRSKDNLDKLIKNGILIQDDTPCFYIYQISMGKHTQKGLMFGASIEEYEKGLIKKHEYTRKDKEDDRTHHMDILNANTGPVMLLYKADKKIDMLIETICSTNKTIYDFTAEDGVKHTMWMISAPSEVDKMQEYFHSVSSLYIADGHHRNAAAFRVCDLRRNENKNHTGKELYNHFLSVAFPDNQLQIMGYYRAVKDLNNLKSEEFLTQVSEYFIVTGTDDPIPPEKHHLKMYLDGKWYSLIAKENSFPSEDPVLSLDVSILQKNILERILNIFDIRANDRIEFIGGVRGTKELERRCNFDMRVAFALYPTTVDQLMNVADKGAIMPPKSTWFEPKLRSGMVIRSLQDLYF